MSDDMTRLRSAALTYGFRARRPGESLRVYRDALAGHVETRDLTAAHEVRIDKPHAAWTPADVLAFRDRLAAEWRGPRESFAPGAMPSFEMLTSGPGEYPPTEAAMRDLGDRSLAAIVEMRREQPTLELAIFASVLLLTGELLTTSVRRADRVALLKALARELPVFGFTLAYDAFIHGIDVTAGRATKRDAVLVQVGTRDGLRLLKSRPYRLVEGVALFDEPPPADLDKGGPGVQVNDPYATVFVSVPTTAGRPS